VLPGCADAPAAPGPTDVVEVVADFVDEPGVYATLEAWRFEGGVELTDVRIESVPLEVGGETVVSMHVAGVRGDVAMVIAAQPPRAASRQVALGGVNAPPPTVPPDPRSVRATVQLPTEPGRVQATLSLSRPWHPQHAVVSVALSSGGEPIAALAGPRTEAGVALVGLAPVQTEPTLVVAARSSAPPTVDGHLDDPAWATAEATTLVGSLDGEPWQRGEAGTVRFLWDDSFLYAAAAMPDRDVWATLTDHDDPLWKEEVFELFIFGQAPAQRYLELQVSPRGVMFDAKFASHRKGDTAWNSAWQTAVHVDGTVDNRKDRDTGWAAEVAVPWTEICALTLAPCPPTEGGVVRVNAFRFERPHKGATVGLALSPTRVPDFHAADNAALLELGS